MSSTRTQNQLCTATPMSSFVQCQVSFQLLPSSAATFVLTDIIYPDPEKAIAVNITNEDEIINILTAMFRLWLCLSLYHSSTLILPLLTGNEKWKNLIFFSDFMITASNATIIFIIFWNFLIFYQICFSPQVNRSVIITWKWGIYEFSHELPNELRLRVSGN